MTNCAVAFDGRVARVIFWGSGLPTGLENFQGKRKLLKNPEW